MFRLSLLVAHKPTFVVILFSHSESGHAMSRLTIDISDQQHKSLKAVAALEGKSIKQYALERLFPEVTYTAPSDEDQAWEEFKAFIGKRVDAAMASEPSKRTITDIFNEVLARDEAA
jgi:Antitoxin ParD